MMIPTPSNAEKNIPLYIPFDLLSGNTFYDRSGNGHDGTRSHTTFADLTSVVGKIGMAAYFPDYRLVTVPYNSAFSFTDGESDLPFSVALWVYINSSRTSTHWIGNSEWSLHSASTRRNQLFLFDSDENYIGRRINTQVPTGQWFHLLATYDGSKSVDGIKLYLNGERADDRSFTSGDYAGMSDGENDLIIGAYTPIAYSVASTLDEVLLFNWELSGNDAERVSLGLPPLEI